MLTAERLREIERDGLAIGEDLTELLKMARRYLWVRQRCVIHRCMGEDTLLGRLETLDSLVDDAISGERE